MQESLILKIAIPIKVVSSKNEKLFFTLTAKDIMNSNPKTILYSKSLTDAYNMMGEERVNTLVVVGEYGELQGTVQSHDVNI